MNKEAGLTSDWLNFVLIISCAIMPVCGKETTLTTIFKAEETVRSLKHMKDGQIYSLSVNGKNITAYPDDFLRLRSSKEIIESGFSSGCGDDAMVCYDKIVSNNVKAMLVEMAGISYASLEDYDSGHTLVAAKDGKAHNWILLNPTAGEILLPDWDPTSTKFAK